MAMPQMAPLVQSLRAAATPAQYEQALSHALDRLSASLSVPETQRLAAATLASSPHCSVHAVLSCFQSVASVCATPPRKAESVGHALLERLINWVEATARHPEALRSSQDSLLAVFQANPAVLGGVLSCIESYDAPLNGIALSVARPLLVAALVEAKPRHVQKLAVVQTLVRVAWGHETSEDDSIEDANAPLEIATHVLTRATTLSPLSAEEDAWVVYPPLVASTVDLLVCGSSPSSSFSSSSVSAVAHAVLRRVLFGLEHQLSVLALLQSLLELARASARALCSSSLLFLLGVVVQHAESGDREQQFVLQILRAVLPSPSSFSQSRAVYVESLVVPLVSVLSSHAQDASPLLQLVLDTASTLSLQSGDAGESHVYGEEGAHAASFLALVASPTACEAWLASLFQTADPVIKDPSSSLLIQLGACLVDTRGRIRFLALDALDRQLQLRRAHKNASSNWTPSAVKLLVSTLVAQTSYRPPATANLTTTGEWLSRCYQVLASLAATTTETMKVILRLIKRMAAAADDAHATLRAQALHLLLLVWKQDSRVYPQLETMLQQTEQDDDNSEEQDEELEMVRMATILAVCEKDPETGVYWISDIQKSLDHDRVSVVAMAVRAISLLCVADCLDFETVVKSFANKIKKNRISCVDDALFQQELCKFYAFGGSTEISSKYLAKVLSDLWEYAEAERASVRVEAFAALNNFSLEVLGLRLVDAHSKTRDEDEDEEDEDLTEHDVEENVDRVWLYLRTEVDVGVRIEIEKLVKTILEAESKTLAPGGASRTGTGVASAAAFASKETRVSAAATKELKKNLPTRLRMIEQLDTTAQWRAYLLAYEPPDLVESSSAAKQRKDKRLRVVTGHIDEMKAILQRSLDASGVSISAESKSTTQELFAELLQSMEAWSVFGRKYVGRFEELARLRTPTDAPVGHTAAVLSMLVGQQFTTLAESTEHVQRWLALGGLVQHASLGSSSQALAEVVAKARAALRAQLHQSIEELRVFKDAKHSVELQCVLLGLVLAHPTHNDVHLETTLPRATSLVENRESELLRATAILFISHASSLGARDGEGRFAQRSRIQSGSTTLLSALLRASCGDSSSKAAAAAFSDSGTSTKSIDFALAKSENVVVVQWAAAIGLAQISSRFALVTRLSWLDSLRSVLSQLWEQQVTSASSSLPVAIALGPVLLESVRHNLVAASDVQQFVSTLLRNLETRVATTPCGAAVLPLLLQRMESYGCAVSVADVEALLQYVEARASEMQTSSILGSTAGNLLYGSSSAALPVGSVADVEFAWEPSVAARIVTVLQGDAHALASVADRIDSFFVVQKTKTFDAQLQTLPESSLVSKTLKFLREGASDDDVTKESTQSTLTCLAHASRVVPLPIDFSGLVLRVLSRYERADQILVSVLDFAASHASTVRLLLDTLLASDRLLNYSSDVLEKCIDALSSSRPRLTTAQQTTLLTRIFEALVEHWSPVFTRAFEKWIDLAGSLVETPPAKEGSLEAEDDDVGAAVATLALDCFARELPFSPVDDDNELNQALLCRFASVVLSKVPERSRVIDCVLTTPSSSQPWSWWRFGGLLNELLRHGVVASTSVAFQWLLRLDFSLVDSTPSAVLDAFIADFVDAVCVAKAASGKKTAHPLDANDTWLLELLDAVARTETVDGAVLKRSVFFVVVQRVVVWSEARSHEAHGVSRASSVEPALVAYALLHHQQIKATGASAALVQRLWSLNESVEVASVVQNITTELHVVAADAARRLMANDMAAELVKQLSSHS